MTARGKYLKTLVEGDDARISIRKLSVELAARPSFPDDPEDIRRALQRYMTDGEDDRDVSNKYVTAISDVLGLDASEWPAATPRLTLAALQRRIVALEMQVRELRDPTEPAQDGGP